MSATEQFEGLAFRLRMMQRGTVGDLVDVKFLRWQLDAVLDGLALLIRLKTVEDVHPHGRKLVPQRAVKWHDGKQWHVGHQLDSVSGMAIVASFGDVFEVPAALLEPMETRGD